METVVVIKAIEVDHKQAVVVVAPVVLVVMCPRTHPPQIVNLAQVVQEFHLALERLLIWLQVAVVDQ
jgi:hypothetical protein